MSYRKKHYPPKPEKPMQQTLFNKEYIGTGEIRDIPSSRIFSGMTYQRGLQEKEVDDLIRNWDDRLLDPLIVSFRDGRYNLIDGQHRLLAMRRMNDNKAVTVRCKVLTGLTYEQEAELVYQIAHSQKQMTLTESVIAKLEAKTDPVLNDIKRIVDVVGFHWPTKVTHPGQYDIQANRALINAYKLLGPHTFEVMLNLLKDTWNGEPGSVTGVMLSGVALFIKTYETEFNYQTFAKRLAVVSPMSIEKKANSDFSTNNTALRCGKAVWDQYNKGCRSNNRLQYRFLG